MRKLYFLLITVAITLSYSSPAFADAGADYKAKCQMCHGADGSGNTPAGKKFGAKDLRSAEVQKQTDAQWTEIIKAGKLKMPAFKDKLTNEQIKDLIEYIRKTCGKT
jgi:mono/diheme cytochrome c family protein